MHRHLSRVLLVLALAWAPGCSSPTSDAADAAAADPPDATEEIAPDAAAAGLDAATIPIPADAAVAGAAIGQPCATNGDCASGQCFTSFPGGACVQSDCGACPSGAVCKERSGQHLCLGACASRFDCRSGYQCFEGACTPPCAKAEDCGAGARCDTALCVRDPVVACHKDADCVSKLCLLSEATCTTSCSSRADCATGSMCAWRPTVDADGNRTALRALCVVPLPAGAGPNSDCAKDSDCASGFCHLGICSEACKTGCPGTVQDCMGSQEPLKGAFSKSLRVCLPSKGSSVWEVNDRPATSPMLAPVPDDAVSFTLLMESSDGSYPVPMSLTAPDGSDLYLFSGDAMNQPQRFLPEVGVGTATVPDTPLYPLQLGKSAYKFTQATCGATGSCQGTPSRTRIFYKLAPGAKVDTGSLALRFFFVGTSGHYCGSVTGATAAGNKDVQAIVSTVRQVYAQAGIGISTVSYIDLNRFDLANISVNDPVQLSTLFATSAGQTGKAANVFFVHSIKEPGILGMSGGIPGPPVAGTSRSGIVASWDTNCYGVMGKVVAHEVAHFLGLFHNIEQNPNGNGQDDPSLQDNLPDTTAAHSNLMYWSEEDGDQVTPGQGYVMRNHFLVELP